MKNKNKTLYELFDIESMEPEKAEEMINRLGGMVYKAVLIRVLPLLSENNLTEYERLMDSNSDPIEVLTFLTNKVPNFNQILSEEREILRLEFVEEFDLVGKPEIKKQININKSKGCFLIIAILIIAISFAIL